MLSKKGCADHYHHHLVAAAAAMSDVWVARKRWTCKYCNVTINDDAPSRRQHENGLRHKGNVERAVREATKSKHRSEADQARARRELQKIERVRPRCEMSLSLSLSKSRGASALDGCSNDTVGGEVLIVSYSLLLVPTACDAKPCSRSDLSVNAIVVCIPGPVVDNQLTTSSCWKQHYRQYEVCTRWQISSTGTMAA